MRDSSGGRTMPLLAIALVLTGACAQGEGDEPPVARAALGDQEIEASRKLYAAESCGICHGEDREGTEGGPALRELDTYWDVERLADYLADPGAFAEANPDFDRRRDTVYELEMPAYDHVPVERRELLARWLLTP